MRFDASRLSVLAGIKSPSNSRRLSEGAHQEIDDLAEIDEMIDEGEDEGDPDRDADDEDDEQNEGDDEVIFELGNRRKRDELGDTDEHGHQLAENQVFEIDEKMLRNEILRMRRNRNQSLAETKLRKAVRNQIKEVMLDRVLNEEDSDSDLNYGSDWVYGNNKPKRSKKGYVARGGFSIGFE